LSKYKKSIDKILRQKAAGGGIMGSNNGSMLVAPTADGTRPGYYGSDAGFGSDSYKDASAAFDAGSGSGENNSQGVTYQDVRNNNTSIQAGIDNAAREKAKQQAAAAKEQKRIQDILDSYKGKEPAAYGYGSPIVNPYNRRFGPKTKKESTASKVRKLALKDLADKKRGDKQLSFSAPFNFINMFNPSRQDVDYTYNTPITTDMMNVNETDYIDQGNYGITGKNLTDIDRINRALDDGRSLGNITQQQFEDAFNNQNTNTGSSGDGATILPYPYNVQQPEEEFVDEKIDYRFGDPNAGIAKDVRLGTYNFNKGGRAGKAEGGIMGTRARRAMGGIMGRVDQRQGYFLGKIVKGVKSAVSGVVDATKKVLKTDAGKLALLAGGIYGYNAIGGMEGLSTFAKKIPGHKLLMGGGKDGKYLDKFNPFKVGALGLGALGLFGNKAAPNEDSFSDRGGRLIDPLTGEQATPSQMRASIETAKEEAAGDPVKLSAIDAKYNNMLNLNLPSSRPYPLYGAANGGRIGKAEGGLLDMGGMEKDYRSEGGFVPIGEYEKKDDVPARLSVNEFVFTADAVRGAGQGDIDKGAEIMENMMKNLENGGTVSEESQGNKGAQQMFETSERLGAVI
jgi:hypothetical protein